MSWLSSLLHHLFDSVLDAVDKVVDLVDEVIDNIVGSISIGGSKSLETFCWSTGIFLVCQ